LNTVQTCREVIYPFMSSSEDLDHKKKRVNIAIRQMEIDDIATVFHLGEQLFTARDVPNLYRTWDEYELINLFQGDAEFCLVAEIEDKIVGFASGTTITKSRSAWKYGYLVWLGVDPDHQGLGIAEKLFHHFRELMLEEGVRILLVDSEADNLPALHFFRKMGFGSPQEHIYLSLNLDTQKRQQRERKSNGRSTARTAPVHDA
jgi:ribosomal protein S18 acetylase RimI-like enzyme